MPYIHVNGFDLYYEAGGQGVPVIFVHGGFPSLASTINDSSLYLEVILGHITDQYIDRAYA